MPRGGRITPTIRRRPPCCFCCRTGAESSRIERKRNGFSRPPRGLRMTELYRSCHSEPAVRRRGNPFLSSHSSVVSLSSHLPCGAVLSIIGFTPNGIRTGAGSRLPRFYCLMAALTIPCYYLSEFPRNFAISSRIALRIALLSEESLSFSRLCFAFSTIARDNFDSISFFTQSRSSTDLFPR